MGIDTDKSLELLFDSIEPAKVDIMAMPLGDVLRCMVDMQGYISSKKMRLTAGISYAKGFGEALRAVYKVLESVDVGHNAEWERATSEVGGGISTAESILCETVDYYGLKSTTEAQNLPFSDWFIMKRRETVRTAVERRYGQIMQQKQNNQNRRTK